MWWIQSRLDVFTKSYALGIILRKFYGPCYTGRQTRLSLWFCLALESMNLDRLQTRGGNGRKPYK